MSRHRRQAGTRPAEGGNNRWNVLGGRQDDGGLTAILGVVTVRFDADTLKALIEARVERSDLPPQEKSRITKWLQQAGSETLKEATKRLVGAALDRLPDAIQLLQTLPTGMP